MFLGIWQPQNRGKRCDQRNPKKKGTKTLKSKKGSDADNKKKVYYAIKIVDNIFTSLAKAKRFLREIRILRILSQHESIVELIDLVPPPNPLKFNKLSIVFEFMPTDLKKIFRSKQYFSNLHIEYILYQILLGLKFCHTAGISYSKFFFFPSFSTSFSKWTYSEFFMFDYF